MPDLLPPGLFPSEPRQAGAARAVLVAGFGEAGMGQRIVPDKRN